MGADLILSAYRLPTGRGPNFERCREVVRQWGPEELGDAVEVLSNFRDVDVDTAPGDVRSAALSAIDETESAYLGHRNSTILSFDIREPNGRIEILICGGDSYGDEPYEGFEYFCLFGELGLALEW